MTTTAAAVRTAVLIRLSEITNRTFVLPLLVFYPTSRCNSRCISCDWWRHDGADDLTLAEIRSVTALLPSLGTRTVAFSGGEPLVRADVFEIASVFRAAGASLQLMTSGVLLERVADRVAEHFSRVYVSLDAATVPMYREIRGLDALPMVDRGVRRLRSVAPRIPIIFRATLHRANYRELPRLVEHARTVGADGISFLAADLASGAFGRTPDSGGPGSVYDGLMLEREEIAEFAAIVERTVATHAADFESGFIAERPDKLRRLPQYYAAIANGRGYPPVRCNAPWISVVLEANGAVRPCFFHPPVGNIRREPLDTILSTHLPRFRRTLDVATSDVCRHCVCSIDARSWRQVS